jgi:hypothetical protein
VVADTLSRPSSECSHPPLPGPAAPSVAATYSGPSEADQGSSEVKVPSGSLVPPATAGPSPSSPPVDLVVLAAAQPNCPDCRRQLFSSP